MTTKLPQFLGVGVQKGGTTTLHSLLRQHPDIFFPDTKEVHYFTSNYSRGVKWYSDQFLRKKNHQISGEITPYYIFHPYAIERISRLLPDCKLIVLLRDPIDRALSQYFHSFRLGFESLPLLEALEAESQRLIDSNNYLIKYSTMNRFYQENCYLMRSRYQDQIKRILTYFKTEQVFIRKSEDMFENPELIIDQIIKFLGIKSCDNLNLRRKDYEGQYLNSTKSEIIKARQWLKPKLEETYDIMESKYQIKW